MPRNSLNSETNLIDDVEQRLRDRLPKAWKVQVRREPRGKTRPDALLNLLSPIGTEAVVAIELISSNSSKYVRFILEQMRRVTEDVPAANAFMAVAPYLSPNAKERLRNDGYSYADATGNFYLVLNDPPVFIETLGAERDPWPEAKPLQSLRGAAAGRCVRALCDFTPPYGIRELANRAEVPAATLSRVADYLEREGIVRRDRPRGPMLSVEWIAAIRTWTRDYSFVRSNKTSNWLEPRGLLELERKLKDLGVTYSVTGSLAASAVASTTVPRLAAVYVERPEVAAQQLGLRLSDSGGNVLLAEPFDDVVFERGFEQDGIRFAGYSQVAADLLTGPGRSPSEGEELLNWMTNNERAWRA